MIKKIIIPILALITALTSCADPEAGSSVPEFFRDVKAVAAGASYTVAIREDGTLWTWGRNGSGQLGDGTTADSSAPVRIGIDKEWDKVSAGDSHTAAIDTDGALYTWGYNYGPLGRTVVGDNNRIPVQITKSGPWRSVSSGYYHTAAINTDGQLWAWGTNDYGQLGDGSITPQSSPIRIGATINWAEVSAGYSPGSPHTVAIDFDGRLYTWGSNTYGQLGRTVSGTDNRAPVQISELGPWKTVSAGYNYTVAIDTDGQLWVWGSNTYGQLGDGSYDNQPTPVKITGGGQWDKVSAGSTHTAAIKKDGSLWAWGYGYLGNGSITGSNTPVKIGDRWREVSSANYTAAIRRDGFLWAWGNNQYGQLGDGTTENSLVPKRVILSGW